MDNTQGDETRTELAKVYFEYFKHFTALSATAAIGVVTVRGVVNINDVFFGLSLAGLGWALVISVLGTNEVLSVIHRSGSPRAYDELRDLRGSTIFIALAFLVDVTLRNVFCIRSNHLDTWVELPSSRCRT